MGWQITCYFDFIDRLYRHIWFWGSGGIVFFDRYACDMYFRKPTRLNELLFVKLFPNPKFVFLCVGDANAIYKRKTEELSVNQIGDTIALYRNKLNKYRIPFTEINTTELSPGDAVDKVYRNLEEHDWFLGVRH